MDENEEIHSKVLDDKYANYRIVFDKVDELLNQNDSVVIAIDGMCGSGKSHLAGLLAEIYDCNVFHMDDFFLPFEMKTSERLAQPGGNVHYERFQTEVLDSLNKGEKVTFRPYLCPQWVLGEPIQVEPKKLTIIEGSYSFQPKLEQTYDLKIFLKIDSKVQKERILKRNGEEKLQKFINLWIPLEKNYFDSLNIEDQANVVIDTTVF
ncbi:MAG: hypothetical protein K0R15_702 [Clostridiales bacterium]|jgi:uridine kinase|nr:hypothetical protein [Clostridiales bacterium]